MLDGFFGGSKWATNKTNKQKLEQRIKDSVLNLVIERDQSFLKTSRKGKTSIIVNKRGGGIQEFNHNGRRFISFPDEMENEFEGLTEEQAENKMDSILKLATTKFDAVEEPEQFNRLEDAEKKYKDITGTESNFEQEIDSSTGEVKNNPFEYRAVKAEKDNKDDVEEGENGSSGSCSLGSKGFENSSVGQSMVAVSEGSREEREYEFQDTDLDAGGSLPKEVKDNTFFSRHSHINKHREEQLKSLAKQIVKSFKGRISKQKTIVPSKRLVSKSLTNDNTEKIYSNKRGDNGKFLKINLIIDMSGSMSGTPVKNAIEMIYIFNEICAMGHLSGNVLWSETGSRCKVNFPMPKEFVKKMGATGGGEGLGENLQHYKDMLKEADTNICMTDGCLTNDTILKSMYAKEKIDIIGVYVNKDAKDLTEYTGSLDRWFTRSLVRNTTEELCEKLIQFSLRKKK
jgi:hypothetical protein